MKILSMKAAFGQLQGDSLELGPGLNIIQAPNEAGKSTWCTFIKTMLYGLNTSQRDRAAVLSDKTKYTPWSGAPMEGTLRVQKGDEDVTLTRTTGGKIPMRGFSAVYTGTGERAEGITAQNAGELLTGMSREVFERTAFIEQSGMRVSGDRELEKKLLSIVSTGDEEVSYTDTRDRLSAWQRRILYRNGGALADARAEYQAVREKLDRMEELRSRTDGLQQEEGRLREELHRLKAERSVMDYEARRQTAQRAEHYKAVYEATRDKCDRLAAELTVEGSVMDREDLSRLRQAYQALSQAKRDKEDTQRQFDRAEKPEGTVRMPRMNLLPALVTAAVAVACGLIALTVSSLRTPFAVAGAALLAAAAAIAVWAYLTFRKQSADRQIALAAAYESLERELEEKRSSCARQEIAFHELALPYGAAEDTERRIGELEEMLGAFETAHHNLDAARETWQAWQEQLRTSVPEAAPDKRITPRFDREQTDRRIEGIETHSRQVRMEIERGIGQMSALGDVSQLSQRQTELEEQIRRLESRYEALKIALEVLDEANGEMQKRFSPEIGRLAGQILSRLTGGKYDQLTFDREFSAMVRAAQGAAPHSAMALSKGTGEQVYLALRLALYRMLSDPADPCPIILDDALAYFDDERAALALQYLAELAEDRQILLFTCHSREVGLLRGREQITVMKL